MQIDIEAHAVCATSGFKQVVAIYKIYRLLYIALLMRHILAFSAKLTGFLVFSANNSRWNGSNGDRFHSKSQ